MRLISVLSASLLLQCYFAFGKQPYGHEKIHHRSKPTFTDVCCSERISVNNAQFFKSDESYSAYDSETSAPLASNVIQMQSQEKAHSWVMNLLNKTTYSTISLLLALLIWRLIVVYELADSFESNFMRQVTIFPIVLLMLTNAVGLVGNIMNPVANKNYIRVVLKINAIREYVELAFNIYKMITSKSLAFTDVGAIPREVYFGRFFASLFYLSLLTAMTKARWMMTKPRTISRNDETFNDQQSNTKGPF
jgi:hypothetical protein